MFINKLGEEGRWLETNQAYDKTFAQIVVLEAITILLAYAAHKHNKLFQMDVKSVFLNGFIKEEVNVHQPPGFYQQRKNCFNWFY